MITPPRLCVSCHTARVAWTTPRVDCCYRCLPGGPVTPPACRRCGSTRYFSQGLCEVCHPGSAKHPGPCQDCLAWGVRREHNWRCWSCRGWRSRHPVAQCPYCARQMPLGTDGACRLCWQQAAHARVPGEPLDLAQANRVGQQLFLANMHYSSRRAADGSPAPRRVRATAAPSARPVGFRPAGARQLTLFQLRPNLITLRSLPRPPHPGMAEHCELILREHATAHGWSKRLINLVAASLRAVQAWQATPGDKVMASEVSLMLSQRGLTTVESTLEVLSDAGLLDDDRVPAVRTYFRTQTADLPAIMTAQLETWFTVMLDGTSRPPRRRPRHHQTIHLQIRGMSPCLRTWAEQGCESLAEITRAQVMAVLPAERIARLEAGAGLRSLFSVLKARKVVFSNPTAGIGIGEKPSNIPMPVDTAAIRAALNSPEPARALAVALVAFHGLTARHIRAILLTDVHDGRLTVDDRELPLAGPVRVRLTAYLDDRARRFPQTLNPYLLVNRRSAPRTTPVAARYPWHRYDLQPRPLREDRILHEIHATGGDVRRICDLFGLSINAAMRYTAVLEHPHLAADSDRGSGTQGKR